MVVLWVRWMGLQHSPPESSSWWLQSLGFLEHAVFSGFVVSPVPFPVTREEVSPLELPSVPLWFQYHPDEKGVVHTDFHICQRISPVASVGSPFCSCGQSPTCPCCPRLLRYHHNPWWSLVLMLLATDSPIPVQCTTFLPYFDGLVLGLIFVLELADAQSHPLLQSQCQKCDPHILKPLHHHQKLLSLPKSIARPPEQRIFWPSWSVVLRNHTDKAIFIVSHPQFAAGIEYENIKIGSHKTEGKRCWCLNFSAMCGNGRGRNTKSFKISSRHEGQGGRFGAKEDRTRVLPLATIFIRVLTPKG